MKESGKVLLENEKKKGKKNPSGVQIRGGVPDNSP